MVSQYVGQQRLMPPGPANQGEAEGEQRAGDVGPGATRQTWLGSRAGGTFCLCGHLIYETFTSLGNKLSGEKLPASLNSKPQNLSNSQYQLTFRSAVVFLTQTTINLIF